MEKVFFDFLTNALKVVTENADPRTRVFALSAVLITAMGGVYFLTTSNTSEAVSETPSNDSQDDVISDSIDKK